MNKNIRLIKIIFLICLFFSKECNPSQASYKTAGVNLEASDNLVNKIAPFAKATARAGCCADLGGFAGFFDIAKTNYKDPILVSTTDGVGTKLKIAQAANKHGTIGQDLVAMSVNDLIVHGAEPVFFLDYFATGKLNIDVAKVVIEGIAKACSESGCALTGGETAEMPGMYQNGEYDLAGFAVGLVERENILPKKDLIKPGDLIIGISSSGLHSNGFSLVRYILEKQNIDIYEKPKFDSNYNHLYEVLLKPTKLYIKSLLDLIKNQKIKALAHITGSGLEGNIPRVLPENYSVVLDMSTWEIHPIFSYLANVGNVSADNMLETFNCGIGMVIIADPAQADHIISHLKSFDEKAWIIGSVVEKNNDEKQVSIINKHKIYGSKSNLKILVIGNGGREHAIAWKVAKSPYVQKIFVAPGNGGTATEEKTTNIDISSNDISALVNFAKEENIDLTIVGPEVPLSAGIVDSFEKENLVCFGPSMAASRIESSKAFAKDFFERHKIPTAKYETFDNVEKAIAHLQKQDFPMVIKADGLAQGKGVVIAQNYEEAVNAATNMLSGNAFGKAGKKIVIEEFLDGEELSFIVITDGRNAIPLASAQDYKKLNDYDFGPNTGGMGSHSPAPILTKELQEKIMKQIIEPTLVGLRNEDMNFVGFLYAGLMITKNDEPKILEYNCRLGDPETQVILPRMQTDLIALCFAAINKNLDKVEILWDARPALSVVLADGDYPYSSNLGQVINIDEENLDKSCKVFHAATKIKDENLISSGGRIMSISALCKNFKDARNLVYENIKKISYPKMHYRTDVGLKLL